jgi:hypothetical protein
MFRQVCIVVLLLVSAIAFCQDDPCAAYDMPLGPFYKNASNSTGHNVGAHIAVMAADAECDYVSDPDGASCDATSYSNMTVYTSESGDLKGIGYHVFGTAVISGVATSNGGQAVSGSEGAAAVKSCFTPYCDVAVSISASPSGVGPTVSYPSPVVWDTKFSYTNTCTAKTPPNTGGGGGQCFCGRCPNDDVAPDPNCNWDSPIIVDTLGIGFHLSDPETQCVLFKMGNDIKCLSWPTVGSGNGFLALPDANGKVTSVLQLFGNQTPVPKRKPMFPGGPVPKIPNPHNGFDVAQGYNTLGTLVLDAREPIWSKLRIWIPEHCFNNPDQVCVSLPSELHLLSEFGIYNIGLIYSTSNKMDDYGNDYRYISHYNVSSSNEGKSEYGLKQEDRTIYDVYLRVNSKK